MIENDYKLYQIDLVDKNKDLFVSQCLGMHQALTTFLQDPNTTTSYWRYNFFSLSASSIAFYRVRKELNIIIRQHVGDDRPY